VKNKAIASTRISKFLQPHRARAFVLVRRHRRVLAASKTKQQSALNPSHKKAPAEAGAFDPTNGFGKISTSRRPGR